jgi:hypothetical protein
MISELKGTFYSFLCAATAFDVFGINNTGESNTCGFQYPLLSISILHVVTRIFGRE